MFDDNILEPLDVNSNNKGFISNKLPEEIKNNYYKLINGGLQKKKNLIPAKVDDLQNYPYLAIGVCIIFSVAFYLLLAASILTLEKTSIIYLILVYLIGTMVQVFVIPIPYIYYSRMEFDENMKKLFNSTVNIKLLSKRKRQGSDIDYPIEYISDFTGEINIPKNVEYVRIGRIQLYFDEDFLTFTKAYKSMIGNYSLSKKLFYNNEQLNSIYNTYSLNSISNIYAITMFNKILCFLLLQWIPALLNKLKPKKCVTIYPVKLIAKNPKNSNTNICVHGKKINTESYIYSNQQSERAVKLCEDYTKKMNDRAEKKRQKEEAERKEKERISEEKRKKRENTKFLSSWDNENYYIKVEKVYDSVKVKLEVYYRDKVIKKTIDVGSYEPEAEEREEDSGNSNIYYPQGKNIKIEVINYERKYTVKIGTKFTASYFYYNET